MAKEASDGKEKPSKHNKNGQNHHKIDQCK
jgi:hypothetical protein